MKKQSLSLKTRYSSLFFCLIGITFLLVGWLSLFFTDAVYRDENIIHLSVVFSVQGARLMVYIMGGIGSFFLIILLTVGALRIIRQGRNDTVFAVGIMTFVSPLICTISGVDIFSGIYPGGIMGGLGIRFLQKYLDTPVLILGLIVIVWGAAFLLFGYKWIRYIPISHCMDMLRRLTSPLYRMIKKFGEKLQHTQFFAQPINSSETDEIYISSHIDEKEMSSNVSENCTPDNNTNIPPKGYSHPTSIFKRSLSSNPVYAVRDEVQKKQIAILEDKLRRCGVRGKVIEVKVGPVVTLFEYKPEVDAKISAIIAREDDIALALQALSLRIIAPIPGKSVIGFEVAHGVRMPVLFAQGVTSPAYTHSAARIPLLIGQDTMGNYLVADLVNLPHLLVAGSTGSGKSVALHAFLASILCHNSPEQIRLILIDPKRLEFSAYADCAHLLFPIVTQPQRAIVVLRWVVQQMEERYELMAQAGVRAVHEYRLLPGNENALPYICIIIDEFADLIMTAGKEVEALIVRLAQMARAAGIHVIIATQRPSVDVITGLIKVNFPARIAFKVASKIDSRTIIDSPGAEKLLGKGDMLFMDGGGAIQRAHGVYITDEEIRSMVKIVKEQRPAQYVLLNESSQAPLIDPADKELFDAVVQMVRQKNEISISLLQRSFRIGYNRAARFIDMLEERGIILPADGSKMRKVLR